MWQLTRLLLLRCLLRCLPQRRLSRLLLRLLSGDASLRAITAAGAMLRLLLLVGSVGCSRLLRLLLAGSVGCSLPLLLWLLLF